MSYKYQQISDLILHEALQRGDENIPSESDICGRFSVSRTTAIKALNALERRNLVRREVGRGTFLNRDNVKIPLTFLVTRTMPELCAFAHEAGRRFAELYPFAEVKVRAIDSSDWISEIVATPGCKILCSSHIGFMAEMKLLCPLNSLPGFQETLDRLSPGAVEWRKQADGAKVCEGLPLFMMPDVLAFNRRYAQELGLDSNNGPRCWSDIAAWLAAAKGMQAGGKRVIGAHIRRNNMLPLSYYLTLSGGEHFLRDDNGRICFNFTRGREWLEYFQRLYAGGGMVLQPSHRPDPILFGASLLTISASTWILGQQRIFKTRDPLCLCPIPPVKAGQPSFAQVGKGTLAIVNEGKQEERALLAAWEFIRYLTTDAECQRLLVAQTQALSVNREVYAEQQTQEEFQPFVQAMTNGRMRCDHPAQHQIMRILYKYYYAAVLDGMPCEEAIARIDEGINLHLEISGPEQREAVLEGCEQSHAGWGV